MPEEKNPSGDPQESEDPKDPKDPKDSKDPNEARKPEEPAGKSGYEPERPDDWTSRRQARRPEHEPVIISMEPTGPAPPSQEEIDRQSYTWVLLNAQKALFDKHFQGQNPANSLVEVSALALPGLTIEIEAIVVLG